MKVDDLYLKDSQNQDSDNHISENEYIFFNQLEIQENEEDNKLTRILMVLKNQILAISYIHGEGYDKKFEVE